MNKIHLTELIMLSMPISLSLASPPDIHFEPNNTPEEAQPIMINDFAQQHYFDYQGDEDWFVFYALKGTPYDIQILDRSVGAGVNPALELYNANGELERPHDFGFSGEGELMSWHGPPKSDFYYLRVFNRANSFSADAGYQIKVFLPFAPQDGLVKGKVLDDCSQQGIYKANISVVNTTFPTLSHKDGSFGVALSPGQYDLITQKTDYISVTQTASVAEETVSPRDFVLNPVTGCTKPVDTPATNPDDAVGVYDSSSGLLTLRDVRVGDEIISAELQNVGDFQFQLLNTRPTTAGTWSPAYYDQQTLKVQIPKVFAFDTYYRLEMAGSDNWLFVLEVAEPYTE